jgi:NADPH:quinone reductase-like Zn-dependent oxidoreductase
MKAAAVDRFGPPSALTLHDVDVPEPGPHEVLIAIETAGIGTWDASIRDGSWRKPGRTRFPLVPGVDGAGIVVARGARVRSRRAIRWGKPPRRIGGWIEDACWDGWSCRCAATIGNR